MTEKIIPIEIGDIKANLVLDWELLTVEQTQSYLLARKGIALAMGELSKIHRAKIRASEDKAKEGDKIEVQFLPIGIVFSEKRKGKGQKGLFSMTYVDKKTKKIKSLLYADDAFEWNDYVNVSDDYKQPKVYFGCQQKGYVDAEEMTEKINQLLSIYCSQLIGALSEENRIEISKNLLNVHVDSLYNLANYIISKMPNITEFYESIEPISELKIGETTFEIKMPTVLKNKQIQTEIKENQQIKILDLLSKVVTVKDMKLRLDGKEIDGLFYANLSHDMKLKVHLESSILTATEKNIIKNAPIRQGYGLWKKCEAIISAAFEFYESQGLWRNAKKEITKETKELLQRHGLEDNVLSLSTFLGCTMPEIKMLGLDEYLAKMLHMNDKNRSNNAETEKAYNEANRKTTKK